MIVGLTINPIDTTDPKNHNIVKDGRAVQDQINTKHNILNEGNAIVVGALAAIGEIRSASMTVMTTSENLDAMLYLGTPFDSSDAAKKTALIRRIRILQYKKITFVLMVTLLMMRQVVLLLLILVYLLIMMV
jgi:hypothetical protein